MNKKIKKLCVVFLGVFALLFFLILVWGIIEYFDYYYIDGPKMVKKCLEKGNSLDSCNSQVY
jgi:hypothetical protein